MKTTIFTPTTLEELSLQSEYKIERADFNTFTDSDWDNFIAFDNLIDQEVNPNYPYSTTFTKKKLLITRPGTYVEYYVVRVSSDNFTIVGFAFFDILTPDSPDYQSNGHTVRTFFAVHPDYRGRGIGSSLLKFLCLLGQKHQKTEISVSSSTLDGQQFFEHFGKESDLNTVENRLYLKDINWDQIEKWHALAKVKSPDTRIETFEHIPESILEDYAKVETALLNDVPFGTLGLRFTITPEHLRKRERYYEELGLKTITKITREADGSISGMTDIKINSLNSAVIDQGLTGVLQKYRGRNLGMLLKSDMLLTIRKNWPESQFISTGNSDKNAPMLRINYALGYKRITVWKAYKFQIQDLLGKIEKKH